MPLRPASTSLIFERLTPWLTLLLLLLYSAANFVAVPYSGIYFIEASGRVVELFAPGGDVRPDDVLLQVGDEPFANFQGGTGPLPFHAARPGDRIPLVLQRGDQQLTVTWTFPGFTAREFVGNRLLNQWFMAYIFWGIGTFALLQLRPRQPVQRLFAAFCYLTAVWLIASAVSRWHIWLSPLVLRSAIWLSVPVSWHLHWHFPQPLARLPRWVGWLVYGLFGWAAVMEWSVMLPANAYALALLLAAAGNLVFLLAHFFVQPTSRRLSLTVIGGGVLALLPTLVLSISVALLGLGVEAALVGLLALPLLPIGYLAAIARHRLGGLELRVNRAISLYLFFVLVLTLITIVVGLLVAALDLSEASVLLAGLAGLAVGLGSIFGFAPFQRFVEQRLLGVPPAPTRLLELYAARISTRLETESLVQLLRDEILPRLIVRESALLRLGADGTPVPVYAAGQPATQLPSAAEIASLIAEAGVYRPPQAERPQACPWVRLALALRVQGQPAAVWLLGARDPDDYYAASELPILQALADQTAVALTNIAQADLLHALYQADINQAETERTSLARELHDGPLQQLNLLRHSVADQTLPDAFHTRYTAAVNGLRHIVTGLRPDMLNYGLQPGLAALVDELEDANGAHPRLQLTVPPSPVRYSPDVEQHSFRIVQQACENARQHAQAKALTISGTVEPGRIDLCIDDDGVGLNIRGPVDLAALAANKHFGLTGMHERAALIGGTLAIEGRPGGGTRIRLRWQAPV